MMNSENNQGDNIDFDPNADYLKEVAEGGAETSPSAEPTIDPLFEQQVIANVAESTNVRPDPVIEAEIESVRGKLGVGGTTPEEPPSVEVLRQKMQDERNNYVTQISVVGVAIEEYDKAVAQYGRDDYRTVDKKKQWDYAVRVNEERAAKIASWMSQYPEHADIFQIKNPS